MGRERLTTTNSFFVILNVLSISTLSWYFSGKWYVRIYISSCLEMHWPFAYLQLLSPKYDDDSDGDDKKWYVYDMANHYGRVVKHSLGFFL